MEDERLRRQRQVRARRRRTMNWAYIWFTIDRDTHAELKRRHAGKPGGVSEAVRTYIEWGMEVEDAAQVS